MRKEVRNIYLVLLHLLVLVAIFQPGTFVYVKQEILRESRVVNHSAVLISRQQSFDAHALDGSLIFFGDSIVLGLPLQKILKSNPLNFGMDNETTSSLLSRIESYGSLSAAGCLVFKIGVNDIRYNQLELAKVNYRKLLEVVQHKSCVVVYEVLQVDEKVRGELKGFNAKITSLNQAIRMFADEKTNVKIRSINDRVVINGELGDSFHIGDGVHLNAAGYAIWIEDLLELF